MKTSKKPETIKAYIDTFPPDVQKILQTIRRAIHEAAPEATEAISYQMPAFNYKGYLVYFARYKSYIGFYPATAAMDIFQKEVAPYKTSTGTLRFPLDKPMPLTLIKKIVKFRVQENSKKALTEKSAKT
jgi:uncharacterized protein YdhG (YjbR/CyaY superfamily)